jgi:FHS family L-fucose permease-like MFS transporter
MPLVQGKLMDEVGAALAFVVPGVCLALVGLYALFDLRTRRGGDELATEVA